MNEKHPFQGISISAPVIAKCPLGWSEDNYLVLATQIGAYIFDLKLRPFDDEVKFQFEKMEIPPPTKPNPHILEEYTAKDVEKMLLQLQLSRVEQQELMLDPVLSSPFRVQNQLKEPKKVNLLRNNESTHLGYSKAVWAPKGSSYTDGCLLSLLSYDSVLDIYARISAGKWMLLTQPSSAWIQFIKGEEGRKIFQQYLDSIGNKEHHVFMAKMKMMAISELTWVPVKKENESSMLIFITASFHLVTISVPKVDDFGTSDLENYGVNVNSCFYIEDLRGYSSALSNYKITDTDHVIMISSSSGEIKILYINIAREVKILNTLKLAANFSKVPVSTLKLVSYCEEENLYMLYSGHQMTISATLLKITAKGVFQLTNFHSRVSTMPIGGIEILSPENVIVIAKEGKCFSLKFSINADEGTELKSKETLFTGTSVYFMALCASPNKSIFGILERLSIPYDCYGIRESNTIRLYNFGNAELLCQIEKNNFSGNISNDCNKKLWEFVDIFESLLISGHSDSTVRNKCFSIIKRGSDSASKSKKLSCMKFWIASLFSKNNLIFEEKKIKILREILVNHATKVLNETTNLKFPQNQQRKLSMKLMYEFLKEENCEISPALNFIKTFTETSESCILCGSNVNFDLMFARCTNGHTMPRCLRTFLPTTPSLYCIVCNFYYNDIVLEWFEIDGRFCLICERILNKPNSRVS